MESDFICVLSGEKTRFNVQKYNGNRIEFWGKENINYHVGLLGDIIENCISYSKT